MRILFLNPYFPPEYTGGAEVSLYHTMRGLLQRGVECTLLSVNHRRSVDLDEWYNLDGIPVHRVRFKAQWPGQSVFDLRAYRAVRREIAAARPDLVHIHNSSGASLAPFLACQQAGVPVVNTLHDLGLLCPNNMRYRQDGTYCSPLHFPNGCQNCLRRYDYWAAVPRRHQLFMWLTQAVKIFISPSQANIERMVEAGYDRRRFRLVPYGVAESTPQPPRDPEVQQIVQSASAHRTILYAGGGIEIKGAGVVLAAIPQLLALDPSLRVVVSGGGEHQYLTEFRRFGDAVRVFDRLYFQDMRSLFACADLTLVPSVWHENAPLVVCESHQAGVPCVVSNFAGLPEMVQEDRTGYLFPVTNADGLVRKVQHHLAKSPPEIRQMRQNCVQAVRQRYGMEPHLAATLKIYTEVIGGKR